MSSEIRYRVIETPTSNWIKTLPFKVPNGVKMLFRNGEWKPYNRIEFNNRSQAADVIKKVQSNAHVFDVEEVVY